MIPTLLRDCSIKKGLIYDQLNRLVPFRVGIEFEYIGNFGRDYFDSIGTPPEERSDEKIKEIFGILEFSQDSPYDSIKDEIEEEVDLEEFRVSISNYKQLKGLYDLLLEASKFCKFSDNSGIHIHIDWEKYLNNHTKCLAEKWFNSHLTEVESIFPEYKGQYNERKACIDSKRSYVNIRSFLKSIEFRIAPLTFDYSILINWIIECTKLVKRMTFETHSDNFLKGLKFLTNDWKTNLYNRFSVERFSTENNNLVQQVPSDHALREAENLASNYLNQRLLSEINYNDYSIIRSSNSWSNHYN